MPIFDQGYQHWNGKLASQVWRWWAITRHGVRMQFRSKLTRLCVISCFGPALALATFMIIWSLFEQGNTYIKPLIGFILPEELLNVPEEYRLTVWTLAYHFFFYIQFFLLMILVLLVGPNLISKDIRFNALPLYLSRPIRRWEYFLGKLGVITFFVMLVTAAPAVFAWILGVLFSLKFSIIIDVLPLLWGSILVSLMISVVFGLWMLALSSLTKNSRYVSMMWFGWWLLTNSLWVMLFFASRFEEWSNLASFTKNVQRVEEAILGTESAWKKVDDAYKLTRELALKKASNLPVPGMNFGRGNRNNPDKPLPEDYQVLTQRITVGGKVLVRSSDVRSLYPWYWSAGVLVFMGVLSLCILMFRVKSLDRLR
ncbi:MAG: ABC transporter permease subunit [Planctomycetia bacterium]|nr:ABC transporter permease subunit [Planctomycetia bacterium]